MGDTHTAIETTVGEDRSVATTVTGHDNSDSKRNKEKQGEPKGTDGIYGKLKQRIADRKVARETARQQERNFLEYRKIMILYEHKPTTKALAKPADDYFPKRKFSFKDMAFGARKSYFLSLRPNAKFAVWHGKKKEQEQAERDKMLNSKTKVKTMVMATAAAVEQKAIDDAQAAKKLAAADAATIAAMDDQIRALDKVAKEFTSYGTEAPLKGDEGKGTRTMMPMAKGSDGAMNFFWISSDVEEVTDEDCPIDSDKVQEVLNGTIKIKVAEFGRKEFNPYDKLEVLRRLNKLCVRETFMMGNTLMSVIKLFPDEERDKRDASKRNKQKLNKSSSEKPKKITWQETIEEHTGQGCMTRLEGRGVADGVLDKKILPMANHVRE